MGGHALPEHRYDDQLGLVEDAEAPNKYHIRTVKQGSSTHRAHTYIVRSCVRSEGVYANIGSLAASLLKNSSFLCALLPIWDTDAPNLRFYVVVRFSAAAIDNNL